MNPADVVNGDDEQFALLLARYSEALNAGGDADPCADPALSSEMRLRLQRALRCLRRLRQFRPETLIGESDTQIMAKGSTLSEGDFVGGQIGRFRILRALGYGGGGIVFLAFDPDLRREVALKAPHLPGLLSPDMRRRFLREARAAARLDHPHLVPVHEVGESNGVCFIVSAYCRGGSLAQWLAARTTPAPVRHAAELLALLADAVQYVHDHGIYHRDLKPGNILLDAAGAQWTLDLGFTPRLTDFGLAKQMDSDSGLSANGVVVGTPSYMAPEQLECRSEASGRRTDVYGLGAVLYELLTGRPPFKGATDAETLDQVLFEAPVPPAQLRPGVPRDLETICLKCLEKSPESRYASAAELAKDLRIFLAENPIQAQPTKDMNRLGEWIRQHWWGMFFGCLAVFVLLFLLLGSHLLHVLK
jgi:eukaryotic-like serine/threonine-protein kinase